MLQTSLKDLKNAAVVSPRQLGFLKGAVVRTVLIAVLLSMASFTAFGQGPMFEVASVKPSPPDADFSQYGVGTGTIVRYRNAGLRAIIADAYDLDMSAATQGGEWRLVGGPTALLNRSFDIEAQAAAGADVPQKKAMLRTLLGERFKLRIRRETRHIPLYALTVARKEFGPGFKRSEINCVAVRADLMKRGSAPEGGSQCWADRSEVTRSSRPFRFAGPMSEFVRQAQDQLDRPLVDETGLTGNFAWSTRFRAPLSDGDAPLFFDAIQQDLGLRIVPKNGPFEVLVIESVEMPTPN